MKIIKGICAAAMCLGFFMVLGAVGGLDRETMGTTEALAYCFGGVVIGGIGAIVYGKYDMKEDK